MSTADRDRWNARWSSREGPLSPPEAFVVASAPQFPAGGRALDVAGGLGRHALWLAAQGLETTLVDVSPVALERAKQEAARRGLSLHTELSDTDAIDAGDEPFPAGPWDVIVSYHFLWRPLFAHAARELREGGVLLFAQPTRLNLERHPRPSERFLLPPGEVAGWIEPYLSLLSLSETWQANGRHEAQVLARRPVAASSDG